MNKTVVPSTRLSLGLTGIFLFTKLSEISDWRRTATWTRHVTWQRGSRDPFFESPDTEKNLVKLRLLIFVPFSQGLLSLYIHKNLEPPSPPALHPSSVLQAGAGGEKRRVLRSAALYRQPLPGGREEVRPQASI